MALSIGTSSSWETAGNPTSKTFVNNGSLVVGMLVGRSSAGGTPSLAQGNYNGVALTSRGYATRSFVSAKIAELSGAAGGSHTWTPSGSATYSAYGMSSVIGSGAVFQAGSYRTGYGTTATLSSAIATSAGGIALCICGRGHEVGIGDPAGWNFMWYQYEPGGGAGRAAYKLTDGTPLNPVITLTANAEWALAVASFEVPSGGGSQVIWVILERAKKFYDDLGRGLIPPQDLLRRRREVFI